MRLIECIRRNIYYARSSERDSNVAAAASTAAGRRSVEHVSNNLIQIPSESKQKMANLTLSSKPEVDFFFIAAVFFCVFAEDKFLRAFNILAFQNRE